jgi:ABC-type nitrate/sulfonate/bicarbonate transport system substrate-binding protein
MKHFARIANYLTVLYVILILIIISSPIGCKKKEGGADKVTLRLNWAPSAEHAFIYLGIDKGFYKENNIDLEVLPSEGSTVVAQLLGNKSNDFGLISGDILVMSKIKGIPIKAVATLYHESPASIYSLKEKNITHPKDLEGKKLGVLIKSTTFQQYQGMLKNTGVERDKIKEVPVSGNVQELLSGTVDAAMHYTNYLPIQIRSVGYQVNEILMKDYGVHIYSQSIATHEDNISGKQALVQRFIDATLKSLKYSKNHSEEALDSLLRHNPELDRKVQNLMLVRTNELFFDAKSETHGIGYMEEEGWTQTQETLLSDNLIEKKIEPASFYSNVFWENYNKTK